MLVRMNTYLLWYGQPAEAGETIDLPEAVALSYIRTGQAEPVAIETKQIEAATIAPPLRNAMQQHQPQLKRR
jgi:hypothetical protein